MDPSTSKSPSTYNSPEAVALVLVPAPVQIFTSLPTTSNIPVVVVVPIPTPPPVKKAELVPLENVVVPVNVFALVPLCVYAAEFVIAVPELLNPTAVTAPAEVTLN